MRNMILQGDVLDMLATMPDESVHCVVTSPPYWGLRDYGTATWEGGAENCDHKKVSDTLAAVATSTLLGGKKTTGHQQEGFGAVCHKCGARRIDQQLGLEPTIEEYVAKQVAVFREVRRVLRADGVCFVNLGDSYQGSANAGGEESRTCAGRPNARDRNLPTKTGLKPKDLCGIPWRVALALQADGWWLRSDIVWAKPNPMPESVTDRPTRSHEYIFMLTKSARYWCDMDAVKEGVTGNSHPQGHGDSRKIAPAGSGIKNNDSFVPATWNATRADLPTARNLRSVWQIPTFAFSAAHFATFPPEIPRRCIRMACPERCCAKCGAGWVRVVDITYQDGGNGGPSGQIGDSAGMMRPMPERKTKSVHTLGFRPSCKCGVEETTPGIVLDPFLGSGTTAVVAKELGRDWIGIELSPTYADMAARRIRGEFDAAFIERTEQEQAGQEVMPL